MEGIKEGIKEGTRKSGERAWPKEDFFNRELSWLEFNQRVLDQAKAESEDAARRHPVFERMKFLSIASSNLDEFFMIRVASINDQYLAGVLGENGKKLFFLLLLL